MRHTKRCILRILMPSESQILVHSDHIQYLTIILVLFFLPSFIEEISQRLGMFTLLPEVKVDYIKCHPVEAMKEKMSELEARVSSLKMKIPQLKLCH